MPATREKYLPQKQGAFCDHDCPLDNETPNDIRKHLEKNKDHVVDVMFEVIHTYRWTEPQGEGADTVLSPNHLS